MRRGRGGRFVIGDDRLAVTMEIGRERVYVVEDRIERRIAEAQEAERHFHEWPLRLKHIESHAAPSRSASPF